MPLVSRTFDQLIDFSRTSAATYVDSTGNIASTPQSRNLLTFTNEFANAAWTKNNVTITANSIAAPDGTMTADTLDEGTATANHAMFSGAATLVSGLNYAASIYLKAGSARWVQIPLLSATFGSNAWANFDLVGGAVGNTGSAVVSATITSAGNGWYRCVVVAPATASGSGASLQVGFTNNTNSATRLPSYTGSSKTVYAWGAQLEQASAATDYTRNYGGLFPPRFDYDPVTLAPKGLLIEEQRTNLLTYSEQFDNAAWTKTLASITANATTSPDGTNSADVLIEDNSAGQHYVSESSITISASTSYTLTVYLKPNGRNWFWLYASGFSGTYLGAYFDITNGVVGTLQSGTTATITPVGNGWYRCSATATSTSIQTSTVVELHLASANGTYNYTGNGTSGAFIWGAQLEAGAFATSYIPTVASQVTRTADVAAINAPNFASWYNQSEGSWTAEFMPYSVTGSVVAQISDATNSNRFQLLNDNSFQIGVTTAAVGQGGIDAGTVNASAVNKLAYAYRTNDTAASLNNGAAVADNTVTLPAVDRLCLGSTVAPAGFLNGHIRSIRYYPTRLTNAQLQALTA